MSSRAFERMLDEMLARLAVEGIAVPREVLRAKVVAACWSRPAVLDDDSRVVDLLSGQEVAWPPIANESVSPDADRRSANTCTCRSQGDHRS